MMQKFASLSVIMTATIVFGAGCVPGGNYPTQRVEDGNQKTLQIESGTKTQPYDTPIKTIQDEKPTDLNSTKEKKTDGVTACTGFEYSRWSRCAADGTQNRVITKTLPSDNCYGGDPVQERSCTYKLQDVGTGAELFRKMLAQIKSAPDQAVDMEYRTGAAGDTITKTRWSIDSLNVYRIHTSTRNADTQEITEVLDLIDTNQDSVLDYFVMNNGALQKFDMTQSGHKNILLTWGIVNTFFGVYILN